MSGKTRLTTRDQATVDGRGECATCQLLGSHEEEDDDDHMMMRGGSCDEDDDHIRSMMIIR